MTIKPVLRDFFWMAAGAVLLLAVLLVLLHFHEKRDPAALIAFRAKRLEAVGRMRLSLASASEAEKSAVMATTDQDSQAFADQARAATAAVEQGRTEMADLLRTGGAKGETGLLDEFSKAFAEFQRIDNELLNLAVQNTNLKAQSLAFGPAADALKEMDAALGRLTAEPASANAAEALRLANGARISALRIQSLLPPHIAEENDAKMDELEDRMAKDDQEVRKDLEGLAALRTSAGASDVEAAAAAYAKFSDLKSQIIKLSRENTNVRSLALSLDQKRKVTLVCQDALAALEQAIQQEPVLGEDEGPQILPR